MLANSFEIVAEEAQWGMPKKLQGEPKQRGQDFFVMIMKQPTIRENVN